MREVSLLDRFDLSKSEVLLNGTQALVRLMLMQKARDQQAGLNTAGYVTGYRGSPLGAVDMQMVRAQKELEQSNIRFETGLNEDLAATAIWGTQQAELRGEGRYDGVFSLWYGKGPGVDRSGDVMRHANLAGSSRYGGVIMAMGDDHTGESSTTCHQSDWAMTDAYIPILSPAGVQEILDYGLYAFQMSRFAGVWAGLKLMKDTVEVTAVVDGRTDRMQFVTPEMDLPADGLNIRLPDHWIEQEARLTNYKRFAAEAFANANGLDKRVWGKLGAKIGFVAAGKSWLDLSHALGLLGLDAAEAERLGITTYKVGQTFPMDMKGFSDWAEGLDLIVVVEEKRKLIEVQVKEAIFDDRRGRRVYGWYKGGTGQLNKEELFTTRMTLDPVTVARKVGGILIEEGRDTDALKAALQGIENAAKAENAEEITSRLPYFCSGCPHNISTKIPKGSRGYAGIGCHTMALWMDRETSGFTHMGGEGANWIGESPFSTTDHVFQNLGDGTYNHSGLLAIRAAVNAGVNLTYKILYNDAVAMTGGQGNDGGLTPDKIAREVLAAGVSKLVIVYDPKEEIDRGSFPSGLDWYDRDRLAEVQKKMRDTKGVSIILYIQTCAAEKRRRRKRNEYPDPDQRVFINPEICEGCGDCGLESNCVSIVPLETELGRKRAVDQSSCNKDFSCLNGFCPSFVTVSGGTPRQEATKAIEVGDLPVPIIPEITGTYNVVVAGIGGTGVVTIGAVLAMAAHIDGKAAGMMEVTGMAQKGGAVLVHCRLAETREDIQAIRVATGECDVLIGGDLVVSARPTTLALTQTGRSRGIVNTHEVVTGDFTRDRGFRIPGDRLLLQLEARLRDEMISFDATSLARMVMGDSIYSNMVVFGAAWQRGLVPVSEDAILRAIELNGAAPERNKQAFALGRWAVVHPQEAEEVLQEDKVEKPQTVEDKIEFRAAHVREYQGRALERRFRRQLDKAPDDELRIAMAEGFHKLLTYKDEYEVARLLTKTRDMAKNAFEGDLKLTYHLAPPVLSGTGPDGRPQKRGFGEWFERVAPLLARMKFLRGTPFDPFGYQKERRAERALIRQYEKDLTAALQSPDMARDDLLELARLPLEIVGFGPVKTQNMERAAQRRSELLIGKPKEEPRADAA